MTFQKEKYSFVSIAHLKQIAFLGVIRFDIIEDDVVFAFIPQQNSCFIYSRCCLPRVLFSSSIRCFTSSFCNSHQEMTCIVTKKSVSKLLFLFKGRLFICSNKQQTHEKKMHQK